jgi:hypothetical protein
MSIKHQVNAEDLEGSLPFIPLQDEDLNADHDDSRLEMDSGAVAWIQCIGSFCLSLGTWGVGNSFGNIILPSQNTSSQLK